MSDDPYKAYREYYENMYRAFAEQLTGQVFATSTSGWAPIPDPATQPVVYHGHGLGPEGVAKARAAQVGAGGGGGALGGDGQMRITATGTNGQGGAGGQTYTCRCGLRATRFTGALAECAKCHQDRRLDALTYPDPIGISSRAGAVHEQIRRRAQFGRDYLAERMAQSEKTEARPEPPAKPTHCGCGASFATVKWVDTVPKPGVVVAECGDCFRSSLHRNNVPIDARIRDAREGRVEDPTTWTAGATPGWEWP